LGNPGKRRKYDELGENWQAYEQAGSGGGQQGGGHTYYYEGDPSEFFGGQGGGSGFSSFFDKFFGGRGGNDPFQGLGGGGRQRRTSQIGNDIEAEMPIILLEAYQGGSKTFELNSEKLRINIKPGSYDGQRLRIKEKGQGGPQGGNRGDLYIVLNVLPDPRFRREGGDLVHTAKVDIYTAILGGKVEIPTLSETVSMTLPKGTDPGKTLRLKGKGMPKYGAKTFGDLLVKIEVGLPKDLSAEEEELFRKLKSVGENKTVYQN